jgi:hypothetical protein
MELFRTLSVAQRNAIALIQISTEDAVVGGRLWHSVTHFPGSDFTAQRDHLDLLEWSHLLAFDQLGGLRCVMVEMNSQWTYLGDREPTLRAGVAYATKGRNIEIILPKTIAW